MINKWSLTPDLCHVLLVVIIIRTSVRFCNCFSSKNNKRANIAPLSLIAVLCSNLAIILVTDLSTEGECQYQNLTNTSLYNETYSPQKSLADLSSASALSTSAIAPQYQACFSVFIIYDITTKKMPFTGVVYEITRTT